MQGLTFYDKYPTLKSNRRKSTFNAKAQSTFVNANALYFPLVHHKKYIVVVSRNKKKRLSWSTSEKNLRTVNPIV